MSGGWRRAGGLTLIELLIVMVIFTLLTALAYGGLNNVLTNRDHLEEQAARLAGLQTALLIMDRDIEQMTLRGIRDAYGDSRPPFAAADTLATYAMEFTRAGWRNPVGQPRGTLQRVAYSLRDGQLLRTNWQVLDRAQDSQPFNTLLLEQVEHFELRFMDGARQWHGEWPPLPSGAAPPPGALPRAVEISLDIAGLGRITRLFAGPEIAS